VLDHDVPDLWSNFRAEPASVALNFEALLSPALALWGGTVRPALGASINSEGETSNVYLDARWQYEFHNGLFVGLGIGGTVHDGQLKLKDWDQKALGSRVLFHFPPRLAIASTNTTACRPISSDCRTPTPSTPTKASIASASATAIASDPSNT
jgi:lipid A 3-O-deacylase